MLKNVIVLTVQIKERNRFQKHIYEKLNHTFCIATAQFLEQETIDFIAKVFMKQELI